MKTVWYVFTKSKQFQPRFNCQRFHCSLFMFMLFFLGGNAMAVTVQQTYFIGRKTTWR